MIRKLSILILLFCNLVIGCKKDNITRIDIKTQKDVDYYCDNLTGDETFIGNIIISTEEELDYKCLDQLKHIKGTLIIEGPGCSVPFRNIVTITDGEVFDICDSSVDTMAFPNLEIVDTGLGISINSGCNFSNILYVPNIEVLSGLWVTTPFNDEERSGTLLGFNKIEETYQFWVDVTNFRDDNLTIDGFRNLQRIFGELHYRRFDEYMRLAEGSLSKLEEVGQIWLVEHDHSKAHFTLEEMLPNLKKCKQMILDDFDNEAACYLKEYIASGDIEIDVRNFAESMYWVDEGYLEVCE